MRDIGRAPTLFDPTTFGPPTWPHQFYLCSSEQPEAVLAQSRIGQKLHWPKRVKRIVLNRSVPRQPPPQSHSTSGHHVSAKLCAVDLGCGNSFGVVGSRRPPVVNGWIGSGNQDHTTHVFGGWNYHTRGLLLQRAATRDGAALIAARRRKKRRCEFSQCEGQGQARSSASSRESSPSVVTQVGVSLGLQRGQRFCPLQEERTSDHQHLPFRG